MAAMMQLSNPPTAVFCFNDRVAIGAYEALAARGMSVPKDVSVIGFDNDDLAALLQPPLSTMVLPHDEMARWAVTWLLETTARSAPVRVKIDCDLITRDSIAPRSPPDTQP